MNTLLYKRFEIRQYVQFKRAEGKMFNEIAPL